MLFVIYRHIHCCEQVLTHIPGLFKCFCQQPGLLVVHDVASDGLSEYGRIPVCVEPVIGNLERQPEVISESIQQVAFVLRRSGNQSTHLGRTCNQDSGLEPDHLQIVLHRYAFQIFEIHVVLLSFADLCGSPVEQFQCLRQHA